jgi:hypothetical protein
MDMPAVAFNHDVTLLLLVAQALSAHGPSHVSCCQGDLPVDSEATARARRPGLWLPGHLDRRTGSGPMPPRAGSGPRPGVPPRHRALAQPEQQSSRPRRPPGRPEPMPPSQRGHATAWGPERHPAEARSGQQDHEGHQAAWAASEAA